MPRIDCRSNLERDRNHRCRRRQYRRLVPNHRPICPNRFPYCRHSQNERRGRIGTKLRNSTGNGVVHSVCRRWRPLRIRYLRTASEKAQATRADMVIMRFDIEYPQHKEEPRFWSQDEYVPVTAIHTMAHEEFRWSLWSRLMRKELFDRPVDCPPQLIFGEDAHQITQLTYRAQKIVTLRDKILYHYTVRDSSVSQHAMTRQKPRA